MTEHQVCWQMNICMLDKACSCPPPQVLPPYIHDHLATCTTCSSSGRLEGIMWAFIAADSIHNLMTSIL